MYSMLVLIQEAAEASVVDFPPLSVRHEVRFLVGRVNIQLLKESHIAAR